MTSATAREAFDLTQEPEDVRKRYGLNRFGQGCLLARRLVERGVRFVTVNMFETVFNEITWDIHGSAPFSPISCYRDRIGPMFDNAYSSLLEDLSDRGLLDATLVLATGEFGRTPRINPAGGRDHWPQCWTIVLAGGGIKGGQTVGSSDAIGAAPKDRSVMPGPRRRHCVPGPRHTPRLHYEDAPGARGPSGRSRCRSDHGVARLRVSVRSRFGVRQLAAAFLPRACSPSKYLSALTPPRGVNMFDADRKGRCDRPASWPTRKRQPAAALQELEF